MTVNMTLQDVGYTEIDLNYLILHNECISWILSESTLVKPFGDTADMFPLWRLIFSHHLTPERISLQERLDISGSSVDTDVVMDTVYNVFGAR